MKLYLLTAGDQYYPEIGDRNWIGCFSSYKEAEDQMTLLPNYKCIINGRNYDWWDIIDLSSWIGVEHDKT